ncbi:MAG: hypothetical protein KA004_05465 [Verrucomicrobiales bacterium]|nr:hypothetical protein [Verrucomicrobiales bacterium]
MKIRHHAILLAGSLLSLAPAGCQGPALSDRPDAAPIGYLFAQAAPASQVTGSREPSDHSIQPMDSVGIVSANDSPGMIPDTADGGGPNGYGPQHAYYQPSPFSPSTPPPDAHPGY